MIATLIDHAAEAACDPATCRTCSTASDRIHAAREAPHGATGLDAIVLPAITAEAQS